MIQYILEKRFGFIDLIGITTSSQYMAAGSFITGLVILIIGSVISTLLYNKFIAKGE